MSGVSPRPGLAGWLRAWRNVLRDPDKTIPNVDLPPEGEPLPEHLDLRCPECGYNLTGLRQWRCPECGEPFSPRRAYTLRQMKHPEYFLRYRFDPAAIQSAFWAILLFLGGMAFILAGGSIALRHGSVVFLSFGGIWIGPNIIMRRLGSGWPWPQFLLFLSIQWLIAAALMLAVVTWL